MLTLRGITHVFVISVKEVIGINREYKANGSIGSPLQDESPVEFVRRVGYEVDRIEAALERHVDWHTHKDPYRTECSICAVLLVARGLLRYLEVSLGPIEDNQGSDGRGSGLDDATDTEH